jgi:hypothetical protein
MNSSSKGVTMFKKIFVLIITASLVSCIGGKSLSKNDVVIIMDEYFEKVKQNSFDLVESYYSDEFYKVTGREKWEELYNQVHSTLGTLISTELESWSIRSMFATSGSGKYFTFVYNNQYENGKIKETINLFSPKGSDEVKIIGHNYNSNTFFGNPSETTDERILFENI